MVSATPIRSDAHIHSETSSCPTCDQPVPNEKFNEITARLKAQEGEIAKRINSEYERRLADEKQKSDARLAEVANDNAKAIERIKTDAAKREVALRDEVKAETEASFLEKIADAQKLQQEAEQVVAKEKAASAKLKTDSENAIAALRTEFASRETEIRTEAVTQEQDRSRAQISEYERQAKEAQNALGQKATEVDGLKSQVLDLKAKEVVARAEGKAEAEEAAKLSVQIAVKAKEDAEEAAKLSVLGAMKARDDAEGKLAELNSSFQKRLDEQRAVLDKAKDDAVNGEKVKYFEEKVKLETQLREMARKLEQKTNEELGEGAEVQLFEDLQVEFPNDRFQRVAKGSAGADIIQEVIHNGKVCGKMIYDSKNRNAWRGEYVSKLRQDQVAAQADHAILSALVLPAGKRQLHVQDGVVIANPARVLILAGILREQVIRNHTLRLSNESKAEKTAALYDLMTSEISAQLFKQIETRAADILDLDVKEQKAHKVVWEKRGQLTRSIQKAHADLNVHIERVLGTASDASDTED